MTHNDAFRDILDTKYGVRYVPVIEIGSSENGVYKAVTEIGLEHLKQRLPIVHLRIFNTKRGNV